MKAIPPGKSRVVWSIHPGWVLAMAFFTGSGLSRLAADEPKKDELRSELEKLRGTWVVKSIIADGKQIQDSYTFTFSDGSYTMEWPLFPLDFEPTKLKFDFYFESTGKFKVIWGRFEGTEKDDISARAQIYRFQGEKLEICYHTAKERKRTLPDRFDAVAGSGRKLLTLERVKPEQAKKKQP